MPKTLLRAFLCVLFIFAFGSLFGSPSRAAETANMSRVDQMIDQMQVAKRLFERITGLKVPANDIRIRDMAQHLAGGQKTMALSIALNDPAFTNVRARNLALRLSNKSQSVNVDFNDTAALITGIIRDNADFREVLTSSYYYDLKTGSSYNNKYQLNTTNPLLEADTNLLNLHEDLVRVLEPTVLLSYNAGRISKISGNTTLSLAQKNAEINSKGITYSPNPDAAGILTTRGFAATQYSGGTNRRPVEFLVKNFLCSSMSEIGNSVASDAYVGKDIDRFVGGNHNNYVQNCKSCHTVMDGLRGAFAKADFSQLTGEQIGLSALAYGSVATRNKNARDLWLREIYNAEPLEEEIQAKRAIATYVTNMRSGITLDYTLATASVVPGNLASLAEKREEMIFLAQTALQAPYIVNDLYTQFDASFTGDMTTISTAITAGRFSSTYPAGTPLAQFLAFIDSSMPATWPAWKKTGYKNTLLNFRNNQIAMMVNAKDTHRTLRGSSFFQVFEVLSKLPELKSLILKDPTKAYSSTNLNVNWLPLEPALGYFVLMGNHIVGQAIAEVAVVSKLQLDNIFANKTSDAMIAAYSEKCLSMTSTTTFLVCDFEVNKGKSFIAKIILAKLTANAAPPDFIKAVSAVLINTHVGLSTQAFVNRRTGWVRYLTSLDQLIYFGGSNFDLDSGVANKMNGGSFEYGYRIMDDSFVNLASDSYGWRGPFKSGGRGMNQFGQMIADSRAFSSCMARNIFKSICYKDLREKPFDLNLWAARFESLGYKVRDLIGEIATSPQCGILQEGP